MGQLIKVVAAIVLTGLLAVLGYNYLGSIFGDKAVEVKATEITSQLNDLSGLADMYYQDNAFAYPADVNTLVTAGYLKEAPTGYTTDGTGAITFTGAVTADLCTEIATRDLGTTCTAETTAGAGDGTVVL